MYEQNYYMESNLGFEKISTAIKLNTELWKRYCPQQIVIPACCFTGDFLRFTPITPTTNIWYETPTEHDS